jgi:ketosteroid isomerase-like protein
MKTATTEQTKLIIGQFGQSLTNRDLDSILPLFADIVDWYIPGNQEVAPWVGRRNTKAEIAEFFRLLWRNTEPVSAIVEHILVEDDFGIVTGEFSTRMLRTGKIVESLFSIHITVSHNKIIRYRLQEDSYAVMVAMAN